MLRKIKHPNQKQKKIIITLSAVTLLLVALIIWIAYDNTALDLNTITVESERLPQSFDGYRIALVSDLHNEEFGENNQDLLDLLRESYPDIIALTGDMIDSRRTNVDIALKFAAEAVKIAPCYYVSGNHEARMENEYNELTNGLTELGVVVLENERAEISLGGETISILGVIDTGFTNKSSDSELDNEIMSAQLNDLVNDDDVYTLLLSHRPAFFDIYVEKDIDLALCGHIHGGQFRLPLIGGLLGGKDLIFPKYDAGLYTDGDTNMVVSRGLGNSVIPFRVNNRPEVVLIELKRN